MANVFDQFDGATPKDSVNTGNVFDQFDEPSTNDMISPQQENRGNSDGMGNSNTSNNISGDQRDGIGESISGVVEPALAIGSSVIAEPIAGLAGIVQGLNPFADEGAANRAIDATRETLTYSPKTESGKENIKAVGETLKPIADVFKDTEDYLGDKAFEKTGSPALAAAAASIPTLVTELLGVGAGKKAVRSTQKINKDFREGKIDASLAQSAPSAAQLKDVSREIYKEIDNAGATLKPQAFNVINKRVKKAAQDMGVDPVITPKAYQALNRFNDRAGDAVSLGDLDTLRKVSQNAASSIDKADAAIGSAMIDIVDQAMDNFKGKAFETGDIPIGGFNKKYKVARDLWGRARRSELLGDAFEKARNQASGFENGIRTQFRSILNNKKQRRLFKPNEIEAMNKVVRGTGKENLAKFVGKFGFTEGSATGFLGGSVGVAGGATIGGPIGAVLVPAVGQVSKQLAQKLTRNNAKFADEVIRSGKDGRKIASSYIRNVPKSKRSPEELSQLLMRNDIDLSDLPKNEVVQEAVRIADQKRGAFIGSVVAGAPSQERE